MNVAPEDSVFFSHVQQILLYHQGLLRDEMRNKLFYEALKRHVTAEKSVLDIGAGSGVWAIAAAKLGAKKVVAIESDSAMIPLILAHAQENGVSDKIEIVFGNSFDINLPDKFEIVISETIGNEAFDENIINIMIDVRKRFLAENGVLIPQKLALMVAPAYLETEIQTPAGIDIKTNFLNDLGLNLNYKVTDRSQLKLFGEAKKIIDVDLRDIAQEPIFAGTAKWQLENVAEANVFALTAESELADGIILDTWKTSSWSPVACRFKPFNHQNGEIEFNLDLSQGQFQWTVSLPSVPNENPQTFSPFFAYSKLKVD